MMVGRSARLGHVEVRPFLAAVDVIAYLNAVGHVDGKHQHDDDDANEQDARPDCDREKARLTNGLAKHVGHRERLRL